MEPIKRQTNNFLDFKIRVILNALKKITNGNYHPLPARPAKQGKHCNGHQVARNWRERRKTRQVMAKASKKINRKK